MLVKLIQMKDKRVMSIAARAAWPSRCASNGTPHKTLGQNSNQSNQMTFKINKVKCVGDPVRIADEVKRRSVVRPE